MPFHPNDIQLSLHYDQFWLILFFNYFIPLLKINFKQQFLLLLVVNFESSHKSGYLSFEIT